MDIEKVNKFHKKISTTSSQIKLIEGEYDFLMSELRRYTSQLLNMSLSAIADDTAAITILGKDLYEEQKDYIKNRDSDEIPVEKIQWERSFKQITDEIIRLHREQIRSYQDIKKLVEESRIDEPENTLAMEFDCGKIDTAIYSYIKMIDIYQVTYQRFKTLRT